LQIPVTVSIGVGRRHGDGDSPAKLLQRADAALYNAKRAGRNRVMTEAA
jgi:two-component system cell cycle response regulator